MVECIFFILPFFMLKINQKITGYKVVTNTTIPEPQPLTPSLERVHEDLKRPDMLVGSTYKVKTPQSEHALYITINDIVLNQGTEHEERHPYEMFINSKNMEQFQWVLALTRVVSAVFRKGGNSAFLVDELKGVFDPKGGYFKKGGVFMPSLVAEIGHALEQHLTMTGHIKKTLSPEQIEFIKAKKEELGIDSGYPPHAQLCHKCYTKAVVVMDGCSTCLSCLDSKCG